jgi:hypothetical protein
VTLELIGNAKWVNIPQTKVVGGKEVTEYYNVYPSIDNAKSKNPRLANDWVQVGSSGKIIRQDVKSGESLADMVFHRGEIMVAATAALEGEIKLKVSGNSGVEETIITVAKVVPPVMGSAETINNVRIGVADQKLAPIVITEVVDEAINAEAGQDELMLVFPQGVVPKVSTMTVEVLEGDMTIDQSNIGVDKRADGRWYAFVKVKSTSMSPAKVKFDNIYVSLDRTVPEGNVEVGITGSAVNPSQTIFKGDLAVGSVVVAKAITPAPGEVAGSGEFKINSNIYYVNGVAKVMDAPPYIKNDRTYAPMRYVADVLGAEVVWDDAARTVTLTKGDAVAVFTIGSTSYTVNGEAKSADVAPEITNSRTMLPARFVAEAFGALVGWDASTGTVLITK